MTMATTNPARGASWGDDDTILFATDAGLFRVAAGGGTPRRLHGVAMWPEFLPDGRHVLVTLLNRGSFSRADIGVLSLDTAEVALLGESGMRPHYACIDSSD